MQAQSWNMLSGAPHVMAVNVSRYQLLDPDFVPQVEFALSSSGLAPQLLELEITESVAMEQVEMTIQRLEQLLRLGVIVAIDDFGKGYSSMDHLKRFPAKKLKIDRSFINDLKDNDLAIVSAMIQMAHQLRLTTTAEGVETETQLSTLLNLGCDQVQGYLLGKSLHPDACRELVVKAMEV
jgi:EAL domain-containing protein (putative c-di-GMP-specific phosphodiesterase class I)